MRNYIVVILLLCLASTGCSVWGKQAPGFTGATGGEQLQRALLDEIKGKRWNEVERRLVESVGPGTFEHLCVSLLQLEFPEEVWVHVGGSGDGGGR